MHRAREPGPTCGLAGSESGECHHDSGSNAIGVHVTRSRLQVRQRIGPALAGGPSCGSPVATWSRLAVLYCGSENLVAEVTPLNRESRSRRGPAKNGTGTRTAAFYLMILISNDNLKTKRLIYCIDYIYSKLILV